MDRNQIAYFLDIASTNNMSRSAERLHVAQPSLSRAMAKLEQELHAALFVRTAKGMELTAQGKSLYARLAPLAAELSNIEHMFDVADDPAPQVRVQVCAASEAAARAIASWIGRNPDCRITLAQSAAAAKDAAGHLEPSDIVIAAQEDADAVEHKRYLERIMLASQDGSGFGELPVALASLAGYDFIALPHSYGFAGAVSAMCEAEGFAPHIVLTSNNPMVVREMIALGLGVGFWPENSWGDAADAGIKLVPLANKAVRDVCVSLTRTGASNSQARACYHHLCESFAVLFR